MGLHLEGEFALIAEEVEIANVYRVIDVIYYSSYVLDGMEYLRCVAVR